MGLTLSCSPWGPTRPQWEGPGSGGQLLRDIGNPGVGERTVLLHMSPLCHLTRSLGVERIINISAAETSVPKRQYPKYLRESGIKMDRRTQRNLLLCNYKN